MNCSVTPPAFGGGVTVPPLLPDVCAQIEADLTSGAGAVVDLSVPEPKSPAWINQQKAPLRIGQLKAVFSLRFATLGTDPQSLDSDGDGLTDAWEERLAEQLRDLGHDPEYWGSRYEDIVTGNLDPLVDYTGD